MQQDRNLVGSWAAPLRGGRSSVRPPTSHDVAREAGVSQPTVSRALRADPRVTEATRLRVVHAAQQLGYVLSHRGRSLSTRRTDRIGVVVEDLDNPFYLELLDALHERLELSGIRMIVFTPERTDPESGDRLLDGAIDGAILTTTHLDSPLPGRLRARGFPFALLNRIVDDETITSCSVDNRQGAALIAAEVLHAGHRSVGAIFGPATTSTGRDREAGIRHAMTQRGVRLRDEFTRRGRFTYENGYRGMREIFAGRDRPTAVLCGNDVVALGAINGARALSLAVPGDVSIVGFDDITMAAWELFELTTVRQQLRRMAEIAVDLVLALVDDPDAPPRRVVLPAEVVHRSTLGPPPGASQTGSQ